MPSESPSPRSKSWSLRSMLGRKGTSRDKSEDGKKKKKKKKDDGKDEQSECGSIKERVLAKLKEPLPSEVKQLAGRHSVDAFSPRLTSRPYASDMEAEEACARHSVSVSRYSTSSSYGGGYSHADSDSYSYQASVHTPSSTSSTYRSMQQATCSSPTSNVIARLMGLGDALDAGITSSRHAPLRAKLPRRSLWMQMQQDKTVRNMSAGSNQDTGRVSTSRFRQEKLVRRECAAQDFLDEMEDHLRQCDKALERIEAVMQLKKKLLYLNRRAAAATRTDVYEYKSSSRRECVPEPTSPGWYKNGAGHRRASSVDHRSMRSYDKDKVAVSTPSPTRPYQHRRSVSDGETPVFRPSSGGNDFIELDVSRSMELHKESFKKWQTVESEYPNTAQVRRPSTPNISLDDTHVHRPTFESNSEQPSPVSVLDSNIPDDSASEDDRDGHTDCAGKKSVVRALWGASEASNGVTKKTTTRPKCTTRRGVVDDDEAEVVKQMEVTWSSGMRAAIGEVGVELEEMIFRRLVEETIIQVASVARFGSPRYK